MLFNIPEEKEVRLWSNCMFSTYEHLNKPNNTIIDQGLYQGQMIILQCQNDDGTWSTWHTGK